MLSILMKYDFKRLWKVAALLCGGVTVCSAIASVITWWMSNKSSDEFDLNLFEMSIMMAVGVLTLAVTIAPVVMIVFIYCYFYKNLMTDEGYLTFTLPTTPGKILISKVLSSICCLFVVTIFMTVGMYMIQNAAFFGQDSNGLIGEVEESLSVTDALFKFLQILESLVSVCFNVITVFFAITMGSCLAKKNKVGASIGCYFLISIGLSILISIFGLILDLAVNDRLEGDVLSLINSGFSILLSAVLAVLFFFISRSLLTHRLNLQ